MKLATALSERADLQRRISELTVRLRNNAKVQEGETPAEDPGELLSELDRCLVRLEELIRRINDTNNRTVSEGKSLTELIAARDCLKQRIIILRDFLNASSEKVTRYTKTEIRIMSTVNVADLQKQLDGYSRQLRVTDDLIQGLNWTTELI
ncbi:MAG: DIP1984 family protein [Eubacteriaceae bacterium]|nr:DIP1984 family protein [Eubacteriaceae bacterium]